MKWDLNCDLGEGEPPLRTRALFCSITSANVACGGHAGTLRSMVRCTRLALDSGVRLGAHPGLPDRVRFGRGPVRISPDELKLLLLHQVSALECVARTEGARLHHIKLHGSLYHATEEDPRLARSYVESVSRWWPQCLIYARAGGLVQRLASAAGGRVYGELFADRAYHETGALVARHLPGAVLSDPRQVEARALALREQRGIQTRKGTWLHLPAQTLCVHSDTPSAPRLARLLERLLVRRS